MRIARIVVVFALCAASFEARAMPNFTRREGFDCSTCHVNIPRLNRFGYEYRNSGFRIPSTIGDKKQKDQPDFGTLNVMLDRHMPPTSLAVVSLEQCAPVYLEIPGAGPRATISSLSERPSRYSIAM